MPLVRASCWCSPPTPSTALVQMHSAPKLWPDCWPQKVGAERCRRRCWCLRRSPWRRSEISCLHGLELTKEFWPGPLTVVVHQQTSLHWDLGDTMGTVAVRMPDHEFTLELLSRVGPMAVSSANISGEDAAQTADQAETMLGESVAVYLDAGASSGGLASTILDCTTDEPQILRQGALSEAELKTWLDEHGVDTELLPPDA